MFLTSFLFLDWKYSLLNLSYKYNIELESKEINEKSFWKYLIDPLYILVVLFLSILLIPSVFLSVYWQPFITFITNKNNLLGFSIFSNFTFI